MVPPWGAHGGRQLSNTTVSCTRRLSVHNVMCCSPYGSMCRGRYGLARRWTPAGSTDSSQLGSPSLRCEGPNPHRHGLSDDGGQPCADRHGAEQLPASRPATSACLCLRQFGDAAENLSCVGETSVRLPDGQADPLAPPAEHQAAWYAQSPTVANSRHHFDRTAVKRGG